MLEFTNEQGFEEEYTKRVKEENIFRLTLFKQRPHRLRLSKLMHHTLRLSRLKSVG